MPTAQVAVTSRADDGLATSLSTAIAPKVSKRNPTGVSATHHARRRTPCTSPVFHVATVTGPESPRVP